MTNLCSQQRVTCDYQLIATTVVPSLVVGNGLPFSGVGLGLVELEAGALGDVALGGALVEAARAMRTLHVVWVLRRRWRGKVTEFTCSLIFL